MNPSETREITPLPFRKKPVEIVAVRVWYANRHEVAAWCGGRPSIDVAPSGTLYAPRPMPDTTYFHDSRDYSFADAHILRTALASAFHRCSRLISACMAPHKIPRHRPVTGTTQAKDKHQ